MTLNSNLICIYYVENLHYTPLQKLSVFWHFQGILAETFFKSANQRRLTFFDKLLVPQKFFHFYGPDAWCELNE